MCRFFGAGDKALLNLPIPRFWGKFKNMNILKLQERIDAITAAALPRSKNLEGELKRLNWQLEELTGKDKADNLKDWKKRFGKKKKKKTNKKKNRRKLLLKKFEL